MTGEQLLLDGALVAARVAAALDTPIARQDDPEASHLAAAEITDSGRRESQLRAVLELVQRRPGSTSRELAAHGPHDRYVIARRLPELEDAGLVLRGEQRICRAGRRLATVWFPVASAGTNDTGGAR